MGGPRGPERGHAPAPALQRGPRGEAPQHGPRGAHHSPSLLLEDGPAGGQSDQGGSPKTPGAGTLGPGHLTRGPSQGLGQGVPCSVPQSPRQQSGDNVSKVRVYLCVSGGSMNWDDMKLRAESHHSPALSCARCRALASLTESSPSPEDEAITPASRRGTGARDDGLTLTTRLLDGDTAPPSLAGRPASAALSAPDIACDPGHCVDTVHAGTQARVDRRRGWGWPEHALCCPRFVWKASHRNPDA